MVPVRGEAGAAQHATHVVLAGLGDEAADQGGEGDEAGGGEERLEEREQRGERCEKIAA